MFSVGQRVWHRDGKRSGRVLECDGDRVYIAQDNGAELDFAAGELSASPPGPARSVAAKAVEMAADMSALSRTGVAPNRALTARDITPAHEKVLRAVPVRTLQAVAALFEKRPGAGRFSALDTAGKLNVISEITAVPYRTMREYSDRPGELGLLMGKGLADSRERG